MAKNNASHAKRTRTRPPKTSMTRRRCPKPTTTDRNSVYAQQAHAERDSKLREVIGPRNEPIHIALELSLPLHKSCTANLDVVSPADGVDLRLLHHHNFIPWKSPFPNALGARACTAEPLSAADERGSRPVEAYTRVKHFSRDRWRWKTSSQADWLRVRPRSSKSSQICVVESASFWA